MSEISESKKKIGKKGIIIIIVAALLLIAVPVTFFLLRGKIRATTMRLVRLEGTVSMEENGRERAIKENLRLKNGNTLNTEAQSLASIGLDDTKVVTMNEKSRAEFSQKGKYLDLNLTKGSLFFEVDKPLEDNESFEIRTSTMVAGIRGTSGYVCAENGVEELILTEGHVHIVGTNPVTGEVKETDVNAAQRLRVYLYNDRKVDSIMFELETITERELPEFVLRILRDDSGLLDKVIKATGWDRQWILGLGDEEPGDTNDTGEADEKSAEEETAEQQEEDKPKAGNTEDTEEQDENITEPEADTDNANPEKDEFQKQIDNAKTEIAQTNPDGTFTLKDGTVFDPSYYVAQYPDIAASYGKTPEALLAHYVAYGRPEGRKPNGSAAGNEDSSWEEPDNDHDDGNHQDEEPHDEEPHDEDLNDEDPHDESETNKDNENGADNGNAGGGDTNGGSTDNGNANGGSTDNGNTNGGSTDSGNANGGSTDSGNANGGSTDSGNTNGGGTDSGNANGGGTDSGNTSGGGTDSGNTNGGGTDNGKTNGGTDNGNTGGNTTNGNTNNGTTGGENTTYGNVNNGTTGGGNTNNGNSNG